MNLMPGDKVEWRRDSRYFSPTMDTGIVQEICDFLDKGMQVKILWGDGQVRYYPVQYPAEITIIMPRNDWDNELILEE